MFDQYVFISNGRLGYINIIVVKFIEGDCNVFGEELMCGIVFGVEIEVGCVSLIFYSYVVFDFCVKYGFNFVQRLKWSVFVWWIGSEERGVGKGCDNMGNFSCESFVWKSSGMVLIVVYCVLVFLCCGIC